MPGTEDSDRPLVELTHVEKHYGDLHVLKDINLTVKKGEVLVIVGPSGSGKSTMCRTINRLETIDSGDIRIDGKPLPQEGKELASLRAEVGMVFQSFNLFANKTILENVTLAPIKVRHMDKKAAEDLAMDLLARVGVASQASKMRRISFPHCLARIAQYLLYVPYSERLFCFGDLVSHAQRAIADKACKPVAELHNIVKLFDVRLTVRVSNGIPY